MTRPTLFFDLLGTLLDEASDYEALDAAMEAACVRFGLPDEAGALSGDFSLALMEILRASDSDEAEAEEPAEFVPFEDAAKDIFAAVLEVRGVDASKRDIEWFWTTYTDVQKRVFRTYPDALPALERARAAGHDLWAVTDADPYMVNDILPLTGVDRLLSGTVTAAEVGFSKPNPRLFQEGLARAGVKPLQAVFVGDSFERDILGAQAAGIPGILLDRHRARTVREVPVISSLTDLPRALSHLVPSLS